MRNFHVTVNGTMYEVMVEEVTGAAASAPVAVAAPAVASAPAVPAAPVQTGAGESINAPMPGNVLKIHVKAGQAVRAGDVLMILEAMKMENEIMASKDGTVTSVAIPEGATVETGALLCTIS